MASITQLEEKITALIAAYDKAAGELEALRKEVEDLRAQTQQKDLQISSLYEEIGNRDRAVESLYNKVSSSLTQTQESLESSEEDR